MVKFSLKRRPIGEGVENPNPKLLNTKMHGPVQVSHNGLLSPMDFEVESTLSSENERDCFRKAGKEVKGCLPNREGWPLNAGCYLRYSTHKFYSKEDLQVVEPVWPLRSGGVITAEVLAAAAILMIALFGSYAAFTRLSNIRKSQHSKNGIIITIHFGTEHKNLVKLLSCSIEEPYCVRVLTQKEFRPIYLCYILTTRIAGTLCERTKKQSTNQY
ncbi:hypothetical protein VNO77_17028 [Canavalia gladiata]|uniref:Uncharacterized protein n=1 Tax=Canavalia gladiata TaxID=3824 RepID=A0AAN9QJ10_CANGL